MYLLLLDFIVLLEVGVSIAIAKKYLITSKIMSNKRKTITNSLQKFWLPQQIIACIYDFNHYSQYF